MNNLNITKDIGFPVQAKTFRFLQSAYQNAIGNLCKTYGDNLILWGCELVAGNRTAGAIVVDGEILPFEASTDNAKILIEESVEAAEYQGGELLPAYYTRVAKCSATGTVNMADLRRVAPPRMLREETDWIDCVLSSDTRIGNINADDASTYPFSPTIQAKIDAQGKCWLKGIYYNLNAGDIICTLPFKPTRKVLIKETSSSNIIDAASIVYLAEINTNGEVISAVASKNSNNMFVMECFELD